MPPTDVSFRNGLTTGGSLYNTSVADFLTVPKGQCLTFKDMVLNYGNLSTRQPHYVLNSNSLTTSRKKGVVGWIDSAGGPPYIYVIADNNKIYRSSTFWQDVNQTTPITYNDVTGGVITGSLPAISDTLNGILIFAYETVVPFKFTSNTTNGAALGGTPPVSAPSIKVVNNYAFMPGTFATGTYTRVYWSLISDPETWPAANFIDFGYLDGDPIRGLGSVGTTLIVFKGKKIGLLSTNSIFIGNTTTLGPFSVVFNNIGLFSASCVDNLEDGRCVFLGADLDVYVTDGYTIESLANLPYPFANVMGLLSLTRLSGANSMTMKYYPMRKEIVITAPFSNFILVYDTIQKYWRMISGITAWGLGLCYVSPGFSGASASQMLLASDANGNVIVLENESKTASTTLLDENGATITAEASVSLLFPQNYSESEYYGLSVIASPGGGGSDSGARLRIGYDNTYSFTTYNIGLTNKHRFDFTNLAFANSNSQRPSTMQLKITSTQTADVFERVYIDTQLEN